MTNHPRTQIIDVKKLVGAWLPKELTVANGDSFDIKWHDEDEYHKREDAPYGTFRVMVITPGRLMKSFKREMRLIQDSDVFAYDPDAPYYQVEARDIREIVSVVGTKDGQPHTFVANTDYIADSSPGYSLTDDAVYWVDGGAKPDAGTQFQVTYKYPLIDIYHAQFSNISIRITIHATELRAGQRGATADYAKSRLCGQLWEALFAYLTLQRGINLGPTQGSFVFNNATEINIMRTDKGESIARKSIDLSWSRRQEVFEQTVTSIGSVPTNTTPEGL